MVRAATTGAFNYAGSDPTNRHWRLRHRLIILGLMAREDKEMLLSLHHHWLGYLSHGNLTTDSFEKVKNFATDTLNDIKNATYPWAAEEAKPEEPKEKNDTISAADNDMIARYKAMTAQFERDTAGQKP